MRILLCLTLVLAGCSASVGDDGEGTTPGNNNQTDSPGPTGPIPKGPPFPIDPAKDPNVLDANGVRLDQNGDLVLDAGMSAFNYLWIANTWDPGGAALCGWETESPDLARCRGTVSKIDATAMREVARYLSTVCTSKSGPTGCADVNGSPIQRLHRHTPSRTAVDFNFDVWVANRSVHGGQPSATKIANDPKDCKDRNGNGVIDTSRDQNGDGRITIDCNGDGLPDGAATKCTVTGLAGKPPEFLGDDDECLLFTVNYAEPGDIGRPICLDTGKNNVGASTAWVGTHDRPDNGRGNNRFYGINGNTGKIESTVVLPAGHRSYGCTADANHVIWSTDTAGSLAFFSTQGAHPVGPLIKPPWPARAGAEILLYGIAVDGDDRIWLGGYDAYWVLRYRPDRASFASLGQGVWSRFDLAQGRITRGIAADNRGKVWVAVEGGQILRIDQGLPDGSHNLATTSSVWPIAAHEVIGVGVDTAGNVWGIGHGNSVASRLDVDASGNVVSGSTKEVQTGASPYTYSDFTGYGLMHFVRPQGRYLYQHRPCPGGQRATWQSVTWLATKPAGTQVVLRVRSGDGTTSYGPWSGEWSASPAQLGPGSPGAIKPNPSNFLEVEFTLKNGTGTTTSPILHEYKLSYTCVVAPD
ncbi:MAG: hypothetical protein ACOY3Y_07330 [Acidobacteriota bacterium]